LTFDTGQPVVGLGDRVARDESAAGEVALDRFDRANDSLVVRGQKAVMATLSTLAPSSLEP
jgi:hypothetical protein